MKPLRRVIHSASASERRREAIAWLGARRPVDRVYVVGATSEAARELIREVVRPGAACLGWTPITLTQLAHDRAAHALAARGLCASGALSAEAVCQRVVHEHDRQGALGHFVNIADRPGLPRALAATFAELRLARVTLPAHGDLATTADLQRSFEAELQAFGLADRALVLREAAAANARERRGLLLLDVPVNQRAEADLLRALADWADGVLATVPSGDDGTLRHLTETLGVEAAPVAPPPRGALERVQARLFSDARDAPLPTEATDEVIVLSAPGEGRECVEICRRIHQEAERGVPFDHMAVLLHAPQAYRGHLEEALRRAAVPAHFARGTRRPDPAGRALLALLSCAAEGLSAKRFAEYLSLGEVPDADIDGQPPAPRPPAERWAAPDDEPLPGPLSRLVGSALPVDADAPADGFVDEPPPAVLAGSLRTPRRWERLLVDAAVIGELSRWRRRLDGLDQELALDLAALDDPLDPSGTRIERTRQDLAALRAFALPVLESLAALPEGHSWDEWLEALTSLTTRALRHPDRVLGVLAELRPMGPVGPVSLSDVRLTLERRLSDLVVPSEGRRYGKVFVAPIDAARGMSFDVVFVPGLAERVFPQKVLEDPILLDEARAEIDDALVRGHERIARERLALRVAVGAARARVVLSYPRFDVEQGRPRVPSFYGLEVLRAGEGRLPGFDDLTRRAELAGDARIGWPAPRDRTQAIDPAEYDLASLEHVATLPTTRAIGEARYLLSANTHLARALRARASRAARSRWSADDGLVQPSPLAREALDAHSLDRRAYSPTALQAFAACPYRFFLHSVMRLAPREVPEAVHELPPAQRGSLMHEVLWKLMSELKEEGRLPLTADHLSRARDRASALLDEIAERYRETLAPAIERVWADGVESIRIDLREVLRRATEEPRFVPHQFELSFGLEGRRDRDAASSSRAAELACGLRLRGSIDLVERSTEGSLRASDYKTGKPRVTKATVVDGGEMLQPVLYALALESLFPDVPVESGRLYFCTSLGDFSSYEIPLDDRARHAAELLARAVGDALDRGFVPAAPRPRHGSKPGACEYCDYRAVCGPDEERRTAHKPRADLSHLRALRELE